jgi:hypothetical protein
MQRGRKRNRSKGRISKKVEKDQEQGQKNAEITGTDKGSVKGTEGAEAGSGSIIGHIGIKGIQDWEFFWLRIWILYYFIVSYAQILSFVKKFFWLGHEWERYDYSA